MKKYILIIVLVTFIFACCDSKNKTTKSTTTVNTVFNDSLAKKLGADDYGMKKYIIAFLKRGPNRNQDSITSLNLQRAHLDNITKLANEGKLVLAGPFFGNDDLRGIYIFNVESIEEAEKLTLTDPAILTGSLTMELKEWYGSAALILLNDLHSEIAKINI